MTFSIKQSTIVFLWSANKSVLPLTKLHPEKEDCISRPYNRINELTAVQYTKLACLLKISNNIWIIWRVELISGKSKVSWPSWMSKTWSSYDQGSLLTLWTMAVHWQLYTLPQHFKFTAGATPEQPATPEVVSLQTQSKNKKQITVQS